MRSVKWNVDDGKIKIMKYEFEISLKNNEKRCQDQNLTLCWDQCGEFLNVRTTCIYPFLIGVFLIDNYRTNKKYDLTYPSYNEASTETEFIPMMEIFPIIWTSFLIQNFIQK